MDQHSPTRESRVMRNLRFNISAILAAITVVAIGLAALREASEIWDSTLLTLSLGVLLVSVLLAIHREASRRAFWVGFALFGWAYVLLSLIPSVESRLLTTKILTRLDSKVQGRSAGIIQSVAFSPEGTLVAAGNPGQVRVWDAATGRLLSGWTGTTENFVRTGHSLIALLAAWMGGLLSRLCHGRSQHQAARPTDVSDPCLGPQENPE